MSNEAELKLCPSCGGKAEEESTRGVWEGYYDKTVYCQSCSFSADRKDWNKRV